MTSSTAELTLVPDEELEHLAEQEGPSSAEAQVLAQLTTQRAQDLQVYAFRVGDRYVTGPLPGGSEPANVDAELIEALKQLRKDGEAT